MDSLKRLEVANPYYYNYYFRNIKNNLKMKDILWYLEDILKQYPKGTVITTDILISCIQKANNQQSEDEELRIQDLDFQM